MPCPGPYLKLLNEVRGCRFGAPASNEMWARRRAKSISRRCGCELQGMQNIPHAAAKCIVDHLMLLDTALALERRRNHMRGPVVVVPGEVLQMDFGIRKF